MLIRAGVNVDLEDFDCDTALHLACHGGHAECVKVLIDAGADVDAKGL